MKKIRSKIVRIGNSRGIRIPSTILQQLGLNGEVALRVDGNHLLIEVFNHTRKGWEVSFAEMTKKSDDLFIDQVSTTKWDEEEWSW